MICYDIVHPKCIGLDPKEITVNDELPNSWECPSCCKQGRNLDYRPRQPKARARKLSVSSAASSAPTTDSERAMTPSKRIRPDPNEVNLFYEKDVKIKIKSYIFNLYLNLNDFCTFPCNYNGK